MSTAELKLNGTTIISESGGTAQLTNAVSLANVDYTSLADNSISGDKIYGGTISNVIGIGIGISVPEEPLHITGANKITGYISETIEFSTYLSSGITHTIATVTGTNQALVAFCVMEFATLYSYVGTTQSGGIKMATTRRSASGTSWRDIDNQNVSNFGDTTYSPTLYWENGVLKCTVASSVQVTCRFRITTHNADNIERNINAG